MTTPSIKTLIGRNLTIPTLPDVVLRINSLMADPDTGTAEIGALVCEDAPLAAKVLRIANSAYYGMSRECVSTEQASTVLGIKVLKNIVTQVAVINQFDHLEGDDNFNLESLWSHASFTGMLCSKMGALSTVLRAFTPEEMYICGLLHDVGKVVLLDGMGQAYLDLVKRSRVEGRPLHQVERETLGFTHTDVGAIVANKWDFPEQIGNGIQFHHGPREKVASNVVVSIVAHSNLLAHRVKEGTEEEIGKVLDPETREQLGLSEESTADLIEFAVANQFVKVA